MDAVERMLQQVQPLQSPPLHRWQPEFSGDIDICIDVDGDWFHEGARMTRSSLVRLFASILRYEPALGYVLVTPQEKWRIRVADVPFIVTAMSARAEGARDVLMFATNVGEEVPLDNEHPLSLEQSDSATGQSSDRFRPYIVLREGIRARLSRPVYYELAARAVEHQGRFGVWSAQRFFPLEVLPSSNV